MCVQTYQYFIDHKTREDNKIAKNIKTKYEKTETSSARGNRQSTRQKRARSKRAEDEQQKEPLVKMLQSGERERHAPKKPIKNPIKKTRTQKYKIQQQQQQEQEQEVQEEGKHKQPTGGSMARHKRIKRRFTYKKKVDNRQMR